MEDAGPCLKALRISKQERVKETRKLEAPGCFGGCVITVGGCSSGIALNVHYRPWRLVPQHQAVSWGLCLQAKPMTGHVVALSTIRQRAIQAAAAPRCPRGCQYSGGILSTHVLGEQRLDQLHVRSCPRRCWWAPSSPPQRCPERCTREDRPIKGRKGLGPAAREQDSFPGPAVTQT